MVERLDIGTFIEMHDAIQMNYLYNAWIYQMYFCQHRAELLCAKSCAD